VATKQVNIDILANDKTAKAMRSATSNVNRLKDNVQQSVVKQQASFNALGNTVRNVIGGVIVYQALRFSKQMVDMASSVEEMQSKSSVVFGRFVESVRGELEKFGDAVGRSTFELEGMASSIQDTFVPMGFARGEASKLAVQLTKLAVDVASFNNASDVETMMAFQSALVGNHETVRRFGVVITEATLKQELLRMGINKTAEDVTNAEKVQARLNLIIAGTADAHGDAIETSGSFANTSKALSSALDELTVAVMMPMLPVLTDMVKGLTNAVKATQDFLRVIGLIPKDLSTVIKQNEEIARLYSKEAQILDKLDKVVDKRARNTLNNELKVTRNLIQSIKDMQTADAQARAGKERSIIISKINAKAIEEETKALKKLKEEQDKLPKAFPIPKPVNVTGMTGQEMGIKGQDILQQGMGGSELLDAELSARAGILDMANTELSVAQQMEEYREKKLESLNRENSAIENLKVKYSEFFESFNAGKEVGNALFDSMMGVTRAIGDAVSQALVFGKSFKDAFGNAARQVVGQLVSSLVQIGVKMLINATIGKALQTASTATSVMVANTIASAYATPAALVSLATAGTNAIPAMAGISSTVILSNAFASLGISGRKLGGRMNQDQPYLVGEAGPELVVPDKASNVVPNGQLGNMGKQVNVNFHITTVDATGFSELLVNSRATIVNVINQALNEKGKEVLV
jgi:hypothetical protein